MSDEPSSQKRVAVRIAESTTDAEKVALRAWLMKLLEIRSSDLPALKKAQRALSITFSSEVIWPSVKIVARETKRLGWDDRGLKGRLGLGGIVAGVALFGGQSAGIAALGTAIGVPLWIVLGAGASFAGLLYETLTGKSAKSKTSYRVIDAENDADK